MSTQIIIGIHGLKNKPPRAILRDWWLNSIAEGFTRNLGMSSGLRNFELAYWADLMYAAPVAEGLDQEPYTPVAGAGPLPGHADSVRDLVKSFGKGLGGGLLDKLTTAPVADDLAEKGLVAKAPDLHRYDSDPAIRQQVQKRLIASLRAAHEAGSRILLVAHSMGSIVAYDVLAATQRELPGLSVERFVTIGSPLGLHEVKQRARREIGELRVPECVTWWHNFADRKDLVALDALLHTDYAPNSRGVALTDHSVVNSYMSPSGQANPHKIYGYLRTPEMSAVMAEFLT